MGEGLIHDDYKNDLKELKDWTNSVEPPSKLCAVQKWVWRVLAQMDLIETRVAPTKEALEMKEKQGNSVTETANWEKKWQTRNRRLTQEKKNLNKLGIGSDSDTSAKAPFRKAVFDFAEARREVEASFSTKSKGCSPSLELIVNRDNLIKHTENLISNNVRFGWTMLREFDPTWQSKKTPDYVFQLLLILEKATGSLLRHSGKENKGLFLDLEKNDELLILGDVHGNPEAVAKALKWFGYPGKKPDGGRRIVVFLGDYVDRSNNDKNLEGLLLPLFWQMVEPENVILLRGNHEEEWMCETYGLGKEMEFRYEESGKIAVISSLTDLFSAMRPAAFVRRVAEKRGMMSFSSNPYNYVLLVHGGIPLSNPMVTLEKIQQKWSKDGYGLYPQTKDANDFWTYLLWGDFGDSPRESARLDSASQVFLATKDSTTKFCVKNRISVIFRGHDPPTNWDITRPGNHMKHGFYYLYPWNGIYSQFKRVVTTFLSNDYNFLGNQGAVVVLKPSTSKELPKRVTRSGNDDKVLEAPWDEKRETGGRGEVSVVLEGIPEELHTNSGLEMIVDYIESNVASESSVGGKNSNTKASFCKTALSGQKRIIRIDQENGEPAEKLCN